MITVGWEQVFQKDSKKVTFDIIQDITYCALQKIFTLGNKLVGTDSEVYCYLRIMKCIHVKICLKLFLSTQDVCI